MKIFTRMLEMFMLMIMTLFENKIFFEFHLKISIFDLRHIPVSALDVIVLQNMYRLIFLNYGHLKNGLKLQQKRPLQFLFSLNQNYGGGFWLLLYNRICSRTSGIILF